MTEPMKVETLERLMSNFRHTPELDEMFGRGLTSDTLTIQEMGKLEAAGYVRTDDKGEHNITEPARKYAWANLPEQSKVFKVKVDALEEKERKRKERERAKQDRIDDQHFAAALVDQGLLVIENGRYRNTARGWEESLSWFQMELKMALEDKDDYGRGWGTKICSRSGDFEGVPVSQPWRYRNNIMVIKGGFRRIKKQLVNSLSEDERELFGLPPAKISEPAAKAKEKLLEVLTKYHDGAASDLVRKGSCL